MWAIIEKFLILERSVIGYTSENNYNKTAYFASLFMVLILYRI